MSKRNKEEIYLEEMNLSRRAVGLPMLMHKTKHCSKCSVIFKTTSKDIVCDKCRKQNHTCFNYYGSYGDTSNV